MSNLVSITAMAGIMRRFFSNSFADEASIELIYGGVSERIIYMIHTNEVHADVQDAKRWRSEKSYLRLHGYSQKTVLTLVSSLKIIK